MHLPLHCLTEIKTPIHKTKLIFIGFDNPQQVPPRRFRTKQKMTRLIAFFGLLILSVATINAQNVRIKKGDIQVTASVGLLPTFLADKGHVNIPPLSLKAGLFVSKKFSLEAFTAFSSTETGIQTYPDHSVNQTKNDFLIIGTRGAVHTFKFKNWDIYGGLSLGYNIPMVKTNTTYTEGPVKEGELTPSFHRAATNNFTYTGFVGATYFVKKNLGITGEVGYGISIINVGVSYKL